MHVHNKCLCYYMHEDRILYFRIYFFFKCALHKLAPATLRVVFDKQVFRTYFLIHLLTYVLFAGISILHLALPCIYHLVLPPLQHSTSCTSNLKEVLMTSYRYDLASFLLTKQQKYYNSARVAQIILLIKK